MDQEPVRLTDTFVCPRCQGGLAAAVDVVRCSACGLVCPVVDGIPHLLIDEAPAVAAEDLSSGSG